MRTLCAAFVLVTLSVTPPARADDVHRCRVEGGTISINNFPAIQSVAIDKTISPLEVRETGISRTFSSTIDLAVGEKRPVGPFPLDGRKRVMVQITQVSPARLLAAVRARWFIRFEDTDAFFDPCPAGPATVACSVGFAGGGTKLRPAPLAKEVDRLEEMPLTTVEVSVGSIEVIGTEGLLVLENTAVAPTRIRVHVVMDR